MKSAKNETAKNKDSSKDIEDSESSKWKEMIKSKARQEKKNVEYYLAMGDDNDCFYPTQRNLKIANWINELWNTEHNPTIHPRGFHYRILGKNYKMPEIKGKPKNWKHDASDDSWNLIQEGFKWARILNIIPYKPILDEKNEKPIFNSDFGEHQGIYQDWYSLNTGYEINVLKYPYLEIEKSQKKFLEELKESRFGKIIIDFNKDLLQHFYMEIWCEKSGIIPNYILSKYNLTKRVAGGGEFSLRMCWEAVEKAKELDKPLLVFLLSDNDGKGHDMGKSVARKIEKIGRDKDIRCCVKRICLTKEQTIKYNLPQQPAKTPTSKSNSARGYVNQSEMFYDYMGTKMTEINAIVSRNEDEFEEELENSIEPHFDMHMESKIRDLVFEIEEQIKEKIEEIIKDNRKQIINSAKKLNEAQKKLKKFYDEKRKKLGLDKLEENYENNIKINFNEITDDIEYELPEAEVIEESEEFLLDTDRDYFEQIDYYKDYDYRWKKDKNGNWITYKEGKWTGMDKKGKKAYLGKEKNEN